jgi:hypothetical protein
MPCMVCRAHREKPDGTPDTMFIGGMAHILTCETAVEDMCNRHRQTLDTVVKMMRTYGRRPDIRPNASVVDARCLRIGQGHVTNCKCRGQS